MKNFIAKILTVALLVSPLAACQNMQRSDGQISKEAAGTVLGGIGGAVLGAQVGGGSGQIVATAAGTLLGAMLGQSIGASLDQSDLAHYDSTSQGALEQNQVGQTSTWRNPDTNNSGTITPTRTYEVADGRYCREYTQTIYVDGQTERAYGTACRQSDGTWQVVQ